MDLAFMIFFFFLILDRFNEHSLLLTVIFYKKLLDVAIVSNLMLSMNSKPS